MIDPVRATMIRTLYGHIASHTFGGVVTVSLMAAGASAFNTPAVILAWVSAQIVVQTGRLVLLRAFERNAPADPDIEPWARRYLLYMVLQGCLWGSTIFLFAHPGEPLSVVLTLSCLYAVIGGSIPGNSYYPLCLVALMTLIFGQVMVRLIATAQYAYVLLGIASFLFLFIMLAVCRVQYRTLREGVRIRFDNVELVEQLRLEKAAADEARQAAEQANLAKSQFLAAASHDLRQPLYALGLFSSSLDELRLDRSGRDVVRRIQDSIGAMESSFDGLLDLSKLEAGIVKPRPEPVDVDALFDRINQIFGPLAAQRGLDLRFRSNGERVLSDPMLLEQVLSNLVSNALRATTTGAVLLAARPRPATLRFEVWDTGKGIAPDDLERIFDDYVQLDNPERDRRRGLGLGLAIARRSVALLDARIDVASRLGRGSRFGFAQPLCAPGETAPHEDRAAELGMLRRGNGPLLLAEDDADVRAALTDLLTRWGLPHRAAADAEAALSHLRTGERFSLLITDQRLPGMSGLELIRAMRTELADPPPAIIITGEVDSPLLQDAAKAGIPVLHKPVRAAQLRSLLGLACRDDALLME